MLRPIAIILLALWAFGIVAAWTIGGLIHVLLLASLVVFIVRAMQGRRLA